MNVKKVINKTDKTRLLQSIIGAGHRVLGMSDIKDLVHTLQINPNYTKTLVANLMQEGWLEPIKKGVYMLSPSTGISPIHEFEIAMHLVHPAVISHYSAFYHHGLTEQISRIVFVTTVKETATPQRGSGKKAGFKLGSQEYRFIQIKKEKCFGQIKGWRGEGSFMITDLERTLLDGFAMPKYCGGFGEVMHGLEEGIDKVNLDQLISYALKLEVSVSRRLGWALEELKVDHEKIPLLLQPQHSGYRLLDPTGTTKGTCLKKWKLRINF